MTGYDIIKGQFRELLYNSQKFATSLIQEINVKLVRNHNFSVKHGQRHITWSQNILAPSVSNGRKVHRIMFNFAYRFTDLFTKLHCCFIHHKINWIRIFIYQNSLFSSFILDIREFHLKFLANTRNTFQHFLETKKKKININLFPSFSFPVMIPQCRMWLQGLMLIQLLYEIQIFEIENTGVFLNDFFS